MTWLQEKAAAMTSISIDTIVWLLSIVRLILCPSHYFLDQLLAPYTPTIQEIEKGGIPFTSKLISTSFYGALFILTLPVAILFFPIRCLLLMVRDPFLLSVKFTPYTNQNALDRAKTKENQFTIASANICLMPEFLSRRNHLREVRKRSRKIGERIVVDQLFAQNYNSTPDHNTSVDETANNNPKTSDFDKISTKFYSVDFLFIQEAWSTYINKALIEELHKIYPYIVHDAGVHSYSNNRFALNSGLMIASRYPVVAIDFKPFVHFCKHGGLMSQGILMVQVNLGPGKGDGQRVGYLFDTHLQAYQEDEAIIPKQMDAIIQHVNDFMARTRRPQDKVLFNFLCGDFNFDNMSPGDEACRRHELFDMYEDFGRERPGVDKDWTVGTEFRQRFMFDPLLSTPEGMKAALQDPRLRRRHFVDANIEKQSKETLDDVDPPYDAHGNVVESPVGGKRRIDLITFHKDQPVKVENFSFVTRLAQLTDHVPVQMKFTCVD